MKKARSTGPLSRSSEEGLTSIRILKSNQKNEQCPQEGRVLMCNQLPIWMGREAQFPHLLMATV
jgi:hypothetical protein